MSNKMYIHVYMYMQMYMYFHTCTMYIQMYMYVHVHACTCTCTLYTYLSWPVRSHVYQMEEERKEVHSLSIVQVALVLNIQSFGYTVANKGLFLYFGF